MRLTRHFHLFSQNLCWSGQFAKRILIGNSWQTDWLEKLQLPLDRTLPISCKVCIRLEKLITNNEDLNNSMGNSVGFAHKPKVLTRFYVTKLKLNCHCTFYICGIIMLALTVSYWFWLWPRYCLFRTQLTKLTHFPHTCCSCSVASTFF